MRIESNRLSFQKYTENDVDFLYSLVSDPEMVQYIGEGTVRDIEGTNTFLNWILNTYKTREDLGLMILVDKENNMRVGHAGIVPQVVDGTTEYEIGYWIVKEHWGKKLATEAAITLRDYGSNILGIERFIALIQPGNVASIMVAKKLGMNVEKEIMRGSKKVHVYAISNSSLIIV
ncbi:GNAT family N-acetyltransferase [Bacillus salitolerans]|uniref:GNAT family N-acetyltransferase n=1 Tax=Bacillus salitolerans TaxID=1437434 RepID=A0ABW4LX26_9BACI